MSTNCPNPPNHCSWLPLLLRLLLFAVTIVRIITTILSLWGSFLMIKGWRSLLLDKYNKLVWSNRQDWNYQLYSSRSTENHWIPMGNTGKWWAKHHQNSPTNRGYITLYPSPLEDWPSRIWIFIIQYLKLPTQRIFKSTKCNVEAKLGVGWGWM